MNTEETSVSSVGTLLHDTREATGRHFFFRTARMHRRFTLTAPGVQHHFGIDRDCATAPQSAHCLPRCNRTFGKAVHGNNVAGGFHKNSLLPILVTVS
jgi:hypothetical protein